MEMDATKYYTYHCRLCARIFKDTSKPNYCPNCGKSQIYYHFGSKARETALRYVGEIKQDSEDMMAFWRAFAKRHAIVEDKMQILRNYKQRGIISEKEMPVIPRTDLAEALKEYRRGK